MTARKPAEQATAAAPVQRCAERPARVSTQLHEEHLRAEALRRYVAQLERELDDGGRRPSIVPAFAVAAAFGAAMGVTFAASEAVLHWLGWLS